MTGQDGWRQLRVPPAVVRVAMRQVRDRVLNAALPWKVQRSRLDLLSRISLGHSGTMITEQTIGGVRAQVVSAGTLHSSRVVVHFHGGGYCVGSPRLALSWAALLSAKAGCRVVLPDYRLAPEHPFPAALDDARAVIKTLMAETKPGTVVLSGDSAGGGLALALTMLMRDDGEDLPAGCLLLSPWLDLGCDRAADPDLVRRDVLLDPPWLDACARAYADPAIWTDPLVSPLYGTQHGLPPLLIQSGTEELLAPDAESLAARARIANVDVTYTTFPGMGHHFEMLPGFLTASDSALAQAAWFVRKVTAALARG